MSILGPVVGGALVIDSGGSATFVQGDVLVQNSGVTVTDGALNIGGGTAGGATLTARTLGLSHGTFSLSNDASAVIVGSVSVASSSSLYVNDSHLSGTLLGLGDAVLLVSGGGEAEFSGGANANGSVDKATIQIVGPSSRLLIRTNVAAPTLQFFRRSRIEINSGGQFLTCGTIRAGITATGQTGTNVFSVSGSGSSWIHEGSVFFPFSGSDAGGARARLEVTAGGNVQITGELRVGSFGELNLNGNFSGLVVGEIVIEGAARLNALNDGSFSCRDLLIQDGGQLTAVGRLACSVTNIGTLRVGESFGSLEIKEDYTQTGNLVLKIGGTLPGVSHDALRVGGNIRLNGVLSILNSAPLAMGSQAKIIDNEGSNSIFGTFTNLPQWAIVSSANGTTLRIDYQGGDGNDVVLWSVPEGLSGKPALAIVSLGELRLLGEIGARYDLQASTNLQNWESFVQIVNSNGVARVIDAAASSYIWRFYQAEEIP